MKPQFPAGFKAFCLLGVFSLSVIESAVFLQHEYPITHFQVRGYLLSSLLLQMKILHLQLGKFLLFTMRWCCISSFSQILMNAGTERSILEAFCALDVYDWLFHDCMQQLFVRMNTLPLHPLK